MADVHLGALTTRRGGIPAHVGLVGLVAFAAAVVSLPAGAAWPFVAVGAVALARLVAVGAPAGWVLPRLAVEVPFLVFALTLAFVAEGPRLPLGPVSVSAPGVVAGGVMLAKSGICVLAALAYARTTTPEGLVAGLTRLRVPEVIVQIASFMARYVGVVADEWRRMALARASRGFDGRTPRAWPTIARGVGVLFLRSYERGERVHAAMLARGWAGVLPAGPDAAAAGISAWFVGLLPGLVAWAVALAAAPVWAGAGLWLSR